MRNDVSLAVRISLLLVTALVLGGCQACVVDSSQPDDTPAARPSPGGSAITVRPRLMSPAAHLFIRDAGDDE